MDNINKQEHVDSSSRDNSQNNTWTELSANLLMDNEILPLYQQNAKTWDKDHNGFLTLPELIEAEQQTKDPKEKQLAQFLQKYYGDIEPLHRDEWFWQSYKGISTLDIQDFAKRNRRLYAGLDQDEAMYPGIIRGHLLPNPIDEQLARNAAREMNNGLTEGGTFHFGTDLSQARQTVLELMQKIGSLPFGDQVAILKRTMEINQVDEAIRTAPGLIVEFGDSKGDGKLDYIAKISLRRFAQEDRVHSPQETSTVIPK